MRNTTTIARGSFFAFLAMVLIAVSAALFLNMPADRSMAATTGGDTTAADEDYGAAPADSTPVVDARIEADTAGNGHI